MIFSRIQLSILTSAFIAIAGYSTGCNWGSDGSVNNDYCYYHTCSTGGGGYYGSNGSGSNGSGGYTGSSGSGSNGSGGYTGSNGSGSSGSGGYTGSSGSGSSGSGGYTGSNGSGSSGTGSNGSGSSGTGSNGSGSYCDNSGYCYGGDIDGASRDITTSIAEQEQVALQTTARHYSEKFDLSAEQGVKIAKTIRDYAALQQRSDADVAELAKRLYGVDPNKIVVAVGQAQLGNTAALNSVVDEAAKNFNTSSDNMRSIVKTIHGKLLEQQGLAF